MEKKSILIVLLMLLLALVLCVSGCTNKIMPETETFTIENSDIVDISSKYQHSQGLTSGKIEIQCYLNGKGIVLIKEGNFNPEAAKEAILLNQKIDFYSCQIENKKIDGVYLFDSFSINTSSTFLDFFPNSTFRSILQNNSSCC